MIHVNLGWTSGRQIRRSQGAGTRRDRQVYRFIRLPWSPPHGQGGPSLGSGRAPPQDVAR